MSGIEPTCLSLILCDSVIEDSRTRNKSLINMFNGILTRDVPVRHDKMCAFAAFTGGRGQVPISLRLCFDKDYDTDMLRLGGKVLFPTDTPHSVVDMVFEIRGFRFPHFGNYTFELFGGDSLLMTRRFNVSPAPDITTPDTTTLDATEEE